MITIEFQDIPKDSSIEETVCNAAEIALADFSGDLSIVLCDDNFIHNLNNQYRGIDRATDVLSFPSEEVNPENDERYLGDIIISVPHAQIQSIEAKHPLADELSLLVIHGILHLFGFDHSSPAEKKEMWHEQKSILNSLGIELDKFSGDE